MAWTEGHELKYWRKTGLSKGDHIYRNYCKAFDLDEYDFLGKKILDIGCGPFGGCFCHHDDLDVTPMDVLADKYNNMNVSSRPIVFGDLSGKLPMTDDTFDYVICTNAIDHIPDIKHGFEEIGRVLKSDGILFLHVHLRGKKELNKAHVHILTPKILKKHALRMGYKIEKLKRDSDWVNEKSDREAAYITLRRE